MTSVKKLNWKKVGKIIIISLLIFSVVSFVATVIVYNCTFPRYDCDRAYPAGLTQTVADRVEHTYPSGENMLQGYLYQCRLPQKKDALIIFAPGHNSCADGYLWQIRELMDLGWSVFAFDATGCCGSEGDSSVGFPQEVLDLEATLKYVENQNRFGYNDIVLLGHSRGGYAACCALGYDYDIAAVVSVSGINSAMEGVIGPAESYVGPLAYGNYGFLWLYQVMLFGSETVNLEAAEAISASDAPVLLIHGENDSVVPVEKYSIVSHKEEITNEKTEYILCRDPAASEHTDLLFDTDGTANDALIGQIHAFLERSLDR